MRKNLWLGALVAVAVSGCSRAPTVRSVLQEAAETMGRPATIQYTATGIDGFFGQSLTAGQEWPRRDLTSYTRTIDYDREASREELNFAIPVFGGQHQVQSIAGAAAWNTGQNGDAPQPAAVDERRLGIILTPHGFLRAAAVASDATLTTSGSEHAIAFTALGKYKIEGTIDRENHVARVSTLIGTAVLGDTPIVATYANYRSYDGAQFPTHISIAEGGFAIRELTVTSVTPGAPVAIEASETVRNATLPPQRVDTNQLASGVWYLGGGPHHSLVVEFSDYVAIVEAPLSDERSEAVMAEAARLVPNKPIRYVLTTHHHFDHTGGLRAYAAEGVTIITHADNVPFFEQALAAPATITPDMQAQRHQAPKLVGVSEKYVLTDGKQAIEVYPTAGDTHTNEYTLLYLPGPKVLVEADAFSPGPPDAPAPAVPPSDAVKLADEIARLGLDVETIAPIHGRGAVPARELNTFIGRP